MTEGTHRWRRLCPRLAVLGTLALLLLATRASALVLQGQFSIRDPSRVIPCNGRYYVYGTGANIQMRYSDDLIHWSTGQSVLAASDNINGVPQWARDASPGNTGNVVWAPDIIFFNGLYHLYWSFSTWGSADSVIGLSTNPTLDPRDPAYKWTHQGPVVVSRAGTGGIPNCIDPAPVYDAAGNLWLVFGSYNGYGIGLTRLNNTTGLRLSPISTIHHPAGVNIEAAYILYHEGYYYLFENKGTCCQGANSTYHIVMGRSTAITGPYRDKNGVNLLNGSHDGGGSLFLATTGSKIGPGHMGLYSDGTIERFTYHLESDGSNYGRPTTNIQTLLWAEDGWPVAGRDLPNGTYKIVSRASGLAMGVHDGRTEDGAPIDQDAYTGSGFQQWTVAATPGGTPQTGHDGYYRMTSVASEKVVDLFNCNPANGTPIDQYPWLDNNCQRWLIEQTGDAVYRIVSRGGGGVINVPDGTGAAGAHLNEWGWNGSDSQKWYFVPVELPVTIAINDVTRGEGDEGQTAFTFFVSLSRTSASPVFVQCRTADDSATTADADYVAVPPRTITIPANTPRVTLTIPVNGDGRYETDEQFHVILSDAEGATIKDPQGVGTIQNDDPLPIRMEDVVSGLKIAGSLAPAFSTDLSRLNPEDPATLLIDLRDAVRLARKAAGLDPNP